MPEYIISETKREVHLMRNYEESRRLYGLVIMASTLDGVLAEVGVFQGGSAKLICEAKGYKPLHLFDTFDGLPPIGAEDTNIRDPHSYVASYNSVFGYLRGYLNVHLHKGRFPVYDGEPVDNKTFAFVHLDVDLYQSMADCLAFFYPRMNVGGMMLINVYPTNNGVKKAVDDFFSSKPEPVIQIGYRQGLVMRQSNES